MQLASAEEQVERLEVQLAATVRQRGDIRHVLRGLDREVDEAEVRGMKLSVMRLRIF